MVVGSRDHIELWEPRKWAAYSKSMNDADALAARITDLGI